MKFTTIYQGDNKIELFNSFFGKETIKVNNSIVSEKYSFFGTTHHFNINENGSGEIPCTLNMKLTIYGVAIDFYKGEDPIIVAENNKIRWPFIIGFIILCFFIGWMTAKL